MLNLGSGRPIRLDARVVLISEVTEASMVGERSGTQRADGPPTFEDLRSTKAALDTGRLIAERLSYTNPRIADHGRRRLEAQRWGV